MIAALLTTLWVIVAIAVFSALAWPAPRSRFALAAALGFSLAWPVVLAIAVVFAFVWCVSGDGRNDLED